MRTLLVQMEIAWRKICCRSRFPGHFPRHSYDSHVSYSVATYTATGNRAERLGYCVRHQPQTRPVDCFQALLSKHLRVPNINVISSSRDHKIREWKTHLKKPYLSGHGRRSNNPPAPPPAALILLRDVVWKMLEIFRKRART